MIAEQDGWLSVLFLGYNASTREWAVMLAGFLWTRPDNVQSCVLHIIFITEEDSWKGKVDDNLSVN